MPGLGPNFNRDDIIRKDKALIPLAIKDKIEFVLRMIPRDPAQCFISNPPDAFQLVGQQQSCINSNSQFAYALGFFQYLS